MTRSGPLTALAALATMFSFSGTATADPYADSVVSLNRVVSGVPGHSTDLDDGDDGSDSLGAPDYTGSRWDTLTVLGYDASNGDGGSIVLAFEDNRCTDGDGPDLMIYEGAGGQSLVGNESMIVEVSDDGGNTFVDVGEVGPGAGTAGYEVDFAGSAAGMGSIDQIRLTATDFAGLTSLVGADVDAVECLNTVVDTGAYMDGCDLGGGEDGVDVNEVVVSSDEFSINVSMTLCGPVAERGKYMVAFDYKGEDDKKDKNDKYHKWFKKYSGYDKRRHGGHDDDGDDHADSSGPDTLNPNPRCYSTSDAVATYYRGREYGPGLFTAEGNKLSLRVDYGELGLAMGSEVLVWVRTLDQRRIGDTVPTVESGDRCGRPQVAAEVLPLTLE